MKGVPLQLYLDLYSNIRKCMFRKARDMRWERNSQSMDQHKSDFSHELDNEWMCTVQASEEASAAEQVAKQVAQYSCPDLSSSESLWNVIFII